MMIIRNAIFIILIFSFNIEVHSQISLKFPTSKDSLYKEPSYYKLWKESAEDITKQLELQNINSVNYWNRFVDYYKALTDDPNDILYLFFDGFMYDKDIFCNSYLSFEKRFLDSNSIDYYKRELKIMKNACGCVFMSYNKDLISSLKEIKINDQKYRKNNIVDWEKQHKLDSINQYQIKSIFDYYGYPGRKIVGIEYEDVFFRVIQHSNLVMMEKYLPIIKNEIRKNNLYPSNYPLLHDRINMLKGLPQEYGTQSRRDKLGNSFLYKTIKDLKKLNQNREKYNLLPINEI